MANVLKKEKALELRKTGKSISEISNFLNVPKSTTSIWCRNVRLNKKQIQLLAKKQISGSYKGRLKFLERVRRERQTQTDALRKIGIGEVGKLNERELFIAGLSFYISEGATAGCNEDVSFTNSDPLVILFMKKWFERICGISNDRFVVQVRINNIHAKRAGEIEKFWASLTNIPLNQFTKTILIKSISRKIYPDNNAYNGTIRLKIRMATNLRRKISGWIEGLLK